jgi:hypothetical protein
LVKDPFWQQGLEAMIVDVDARERLREQAVAWGRTQTIENHAHLWESVFERAATRARGGQPPPEVTGPELDREPEVDQSRRVEVEPAPPERRGLMRRLMRR